uniref:JNK1/MAPK8-associated membrane protein-like n=1 Tax=Anadara broughtonii TaxID=148819 RepID=A0A2P1E2K5_ANABR|nr:JNK1/MAPK8-associated membrane protein-like [Anadara broughtonii]
MFSQIKFKYKISIWLFTVLVIGNSATVSNGSVKVPEKCPGLYCGRITLDTGQFSECGACPRGYQPDDVSVCRRCDTNPTFYDWMFLGFMAILSLVLHWFFIDFTNKIKGSLIVLHISALIESVLAAIFTVLLVDPMAEFNIRSCPVKQLSDWYSMLYNPSPNYTDTIHCTREIVYPLYTISMVYYAFSLVLMMLIRPFLSYKFLDKKGTNSIYAALYFHPILIVLQAVFGGLLYYAFPYIVIVLSIVTNATHLASSPDQNVRKLFKWTFCDARNLTIIIGHWFLHAFGIIAMTQLADPYIHIPLLALVPFPTIFYILTVQFTHPDHIETVS